MDYEPLAPETNTCNNNNNENVFNCKNFELREQGEEEREEEGEGFPLMDLPPLVLVVVLGSLTANEVSMMSQTCNELYRLCQHNGVWKRVAKRKWGLRPSKGVMRPTRWKHYFSHKMAVMREGSFKWEPITTNGDVISKRYQHTGSAVGNDLYFIGGQELPEKRFDEIFVLHTDTMTVGKVNPVSGLPPKFARHTAVTIEKKIYLFGGFDGVSRHFHLSVFDTISTEWASPRPQGPPPPSRTNHSAVAVGSKMYVFGGMYKDNAGGNDKLIFLNDMYALNTEGQLRWDRIPQKGDLPTPRCGHRMAVFGHMLVLFGGGCGEQWDSKFSDVYVFDTTTNEWVKPKITGQAPVCTFTVTFSAGVFLFVFGGQSLHDNNLTNDLYCLDTVSMTWSLVTPQGTKPGARDMASGNVVGSNMFMFGGYCGNAIDNLFKLQMDPDIAALPTPSLSPFA